MKSPHSPGGTECGGSIEVPPPETAPTMTEEEQQNYENQMEKMKEYQKNMGKN